MSRKRRDRLVKDRPIESPKLRDIELIAMLKQLEVLAQAANLPPELMDRVSGEISQKIGQGRLNVENRLAGLRAEDEFMLMALLLGNTEQITPLEQKQRINWTRYGIPDFLMSVVVPKQFVRGDQRNIQRMFVEVKTARNAGTAFLLPIQLFTRLSVFGKLYTIPVYFALRMKTTGSTYWFLISARTLLSISKQVVGKTRGREEQCLSVQLVDMIKEDLSGLWLSNYTVLIPAGFHMRLTFSDSSDSPVSDDEFGKLARLEAKGPWGAKIIEIHPGMAAESILTHEVLRRMEIGVKTVEKTAGGFEVSYECKDNYSVPFYWLVLDTYLYLREKFEPYVSKTPSLKPTLEYFLEVFSDFDRNLASGIRNVIWKLHEDRLILPIKMVPERYLGKRFDRGELRTTG